MLLPTKCMSSVLKSPSAWEVEEKHQFQYLNKASALFKCVLLSLMSGTSQCHETQQMQPEVRTLFKGKTGVGNTSATARGKTQIRSIIIIILWLISGGQKEVLFIQVYVHICLCAFLYIQIYIFEEKRILGFCPDHILNTAEGKIGSIPGKGVSVDRTLKGRQCELPILSSLNCFGGTWVNVSWRVSAAIFREIFSYLSCLFAQEALNGYTTSLSLSKSTST